MHLVVGLGNPGTKYELTRHNAGFLIVDQLAEQAGVQFQKSKFSGEVARSKLFGNDVFLLKPTTYMNLSGNSVSQLANFYKIPVERIAVIHDDIDLPPGKVKSRLGGGHGGHNGIRSMIDRLGASQFFRIKIGFGKPQAEHPDTVSNWVLGQMTEAELQWLGHEAVEESVERLKGFLVPKSPSSHK